MPIDMMSDKPIAPIAVAQHVIDDSRGNPNLRIKTIFQDQFRLGVLHNVSLEIAHPHSITIVTDPASPNDKALKVTLNRHDPDVRNSKRSEIALSTVPVDKEYDYFFSEYLPSSYVSDPSPEIIAQWHGMPDKHLGETWRSPYLALITQQGRLWLKGIWDADPITRNNKPGRNGGYFSADLGPYQTNQWYHFRLHAKWSYKTDGLLEFYNDQQLLFRRQGPNRYNDVSGPYFKAGLYKWEWKQAPQRSRIQQRTLYLKDVRVEQDTL